MSEPIQSIAQNNYILATQQEVSHDNTLSGNGTVDSPLGVVPGYNETVLWDGNGALSSSVNLSENMNNFEFIDVYERWDVAIANATVHRIYMEGKSSAVINFAIGVNGWYLVVQKLNLNGTSLSVDSAHAIHGSSYTSTDLTHESNTTLLKRTIIKVIGINRKA